MTALFSNLFAWYTTKIKPRLRQEDGATTLEYVIIAAIVCAAAVIVAAVIVGAINSFSAKIPKGP